MREPATTNLERASDVMIELARERAHRAMFGFSRSTVRVGRYVVLHRVGAGAMGVVFAALDPELGRRIALKLVSARRDDEGTSLHARLVREAQALAKLTHPNVVAIHDVGVVEGEGDAGAATAVFIAMEFIEGQTLRAWSARESRSWTDVVAVMVQAGRGLAAAHAVGLVHRDFKADNVMIDADPRGAHAFGRVRVTDFGLARAEATAGDPGDTGEHAPGDDVQSGNDRVTRTLTRQGVLVGTPAYMSPEQHDSRPVDARSDQFSFCVTLWEALFGARPFVGKSVVELAVAIRELVPVAPPRSNVPRWLVAIVTRGLAPDPESRYPDMDALLAALADDPTHRRRRRWIAGAVALTIVGVAGGLAARRAARARACASAGAEIGDVWSAAARERVHAGLVATGVGYARDTADRVLPWLDDYATDWTSLRERSCVRATVENTMVAELHERGEACFAERKAAFAQLVELFADADPHMPPQAVESAAALPQVPACDDEDRLRARPLPTGDATQREEIAATRHALAQMRVRASVGRSAEVGELDAMLERAEELAWPPLVAEIGLALGSVAAEHGEYESAEAKLEQAYYVAHGAGYDEVAADIASQLCRVVAEWRGRTDDGRQWGRLAHADLERLAVPDDLRLALLLQREATLDYEAAAFDTALAEFERATELRTAILGADHPDVLGLLHGIANVHQARGHFDAARDAYDDLLRKYQAILGPGHPEVGSLYMDLGTLYGSNGRWDDARAVFEKALAIREAAYGPEHAMVASVLVNLGSVHHAQRNDDEALRAHRRALAIQDAALGPEHPDLGPTLNGIGNILHDRAEYDEAIAARLRAIAIWERAYGPDHPAVATALLNNGNTQRLLGQPERAMASYRRALAIREKVLGADHPGVANAAYVLAEAELQEGALDDAMRGFTQALAIRERAFGADHPQVAVAVGGVGRVELARGDEAAARTALERALAILDRAEADPVEEAEVRFAAAKALWPIAGERARARELASQALRSYETAPPSFAGARATVERWLAAH